MKTEHTHGFWMANEGQIYPEQTGKTLALIPCFDENNDEQDANAKLIAAAPELLKMVYDLKNCIKRLTSDELTQFDKDLEAEWIGEAHELLYKINPNYQY